MVPDLVEPGIVKRLYSMSAASHTPISGTFELTPVCNMCCEMCYVRMTPEEMDRTGGRLRTADEWLHLAEAARERGMTFLLLTGGEPFLYPDFKTLYQNLSKMGFVISINTNATLIDEHVIEWMKEDPPFRVNITLYGASDETYGRLCHNPRGYTQVTHALRLLEEVGIMVKLNCSVTPYNLDDLPDMVRFAEEHGLILQAASYMFPPMRRDEEMVGRNKRFTPEEAAEAAGEIVRLQNGDEKFLQYVEHLKEGKIFMELPDDGCQREEGNIIQCSAGRCAFWITWDGKMLPCGMMTRPVTYPFRDGFLKAWEQTGEAVRPIRLPVTCANCKYQEQCHSCAAMVLTETGTFDQVPEYRCRMTKTYLEKCMEIRDRIEPKESEEA